MIILGIVCSDGVSDLKCAAAIFSVSSVVLCKRCCSGIVKLPNSKYNEERVIDGVLNLNVFICFAIMIRFSKYLYISKEYRTLFTRL